VLNKTANHEDMGEWSYRSTPILIRFSVIKFLFVLVLAPVIILMSALDEGK
jgi:hypothetical protein